ncbi:MAG: TIGR02281 family clan AA aspartic protease [Xanthobacteraceae bacterium]
MRFIITFAAVALVVGMIVPQFATQIYAPRAPHNLMAAREATPVAPVSSDPDSVVVAPDAMGHFRVEGRIDGRFLQFVVDTGASVVALTADDAAALGIHPAEIDFRALVKTANGTVRAAPVQLDMVEVGNLLVRDVAAMVLPDGALSDNLLGLSFLSRLRRFEYADGKMVLEQ